MGAVTGKASCSSFACGHARNEIDYRGADLEPPEVGISIDDGPSPMHKALSSELVDDRRRETADLPSADDKVAAAQLHDCEEIQVGKTVSQPAMRSEPSTRSSTAEELAPSPAGATSSRCDINDEGSKLKPVWPSNPEKPKQSSSRSSIKQKGAIKDQTDKEIPHPKEKKEKKEKKEAKKEPPKKSYLQKIKERKEQLEKDKEKNRQLVDDIMAGKYKTQNGAQPAGNMLIKMPSPADRKNTRIMILEQFRSQYRRIGKQSDCPSASAPAQYSAAETSALQIDGGHQSLPRPENVQLPKDFRKPIGKLTLQKLADYGCDNKRKLCSVYGDIFDVSDRPDKYGTNGPYAWMAGRDITWGFVSGKDVPATVNQCFDLWKIAPDHFRDSILKRIFAWVAFYEFEYGDPVARLDLYENENGLKGPPMEEAEDCCIM